MVALAPTEDGLPADTYAVLARVRICLVSPLLTLSQVRNVIPGNGTAQGSFEIRIQEVPYDTGDAGADNIDNTGEVDEPVGASWMVAQRGTYNLPGGVVFVVSQALRCCPQPQRRLERRTLCPSKEACPSGCLHSTLWMTRSLLTRLLPCWRWWVLLSCAGTQLGTGHVGQQRAVRRHDITTNQLFGLHEPSVSAVALRHHC